jgi:hypothetical protein
MKMGRRTLYLEIDSAVPLTAEKRIFRAVSDAQPSGRHVTAPWML